MDFLATHNAMIFLVMRLWMEYAPNVAQYPIIIIIEGVNGFVFDNNWYILQESYQGNHISYHQTLHSSNPALDAS